MNSQNPKVARIGTIYVDAFPSLLRENGIEPSLSFSKHPEYCNESNRRMSFVSWPSYYRQQPRALAEAGFFSLDVRDHVKCFHCGVNLGNWEPQDEPWEEHARHSPRCQWLLQQKGQRFIDDVKKKYNNSEDFLDMNRISLDGCESSVNGDHIKHAFAKNPNYCRESSRRETFLNWPVNRRQKPHTLAQAGFFSRGVGDHVVCFYCGVTLGNWEPQDEPWEEHARHSPHCQWLIEQKGRRFIDDVTKKYHCLQDSHNVNTASKDGDENVTDEDQMLYLFAKYSTYCSPGRRFSSFSNWPVDHCQQPHTLAQAGFFSRGIGDRVTCFYCGATLVNWVPEDDPWEEHARHNPHCKWLLKQKGQNFVDQVAKKYASKITFPSDPPTSYPLKLETDMDAVDPPSIRQNPPRPAPRERGNIRHDNKILADRDTVEMTKKMGQVQINEASTLPGELEKLREKILCKICLDDDLTVVFHPCKHMVACKDCADQLETCPICRKHIDEKIQVFMS